MTPICHIPMLDCRSGLHTVRICVGPVLLVITESSLDQLETQIFGAALRPLVVLHLVSLFDFPQGAN